MNNRITLRNQIDRAWDATVEKHYKRQRINSESSLRASFWSQLNEILENELPDSRRLFVEPSMRIKLTVGEEIVKQRKYPDIVVCDKKQIIAIIELKYRPKVKPAYKKDLATFEWITDNRSIISIENNRYLGAPMDSKRYPIAKNLLYVWAGIHAPTAQVNLRPLVRQDFRRYLHEIHYVTSKEEIASAERQEI